MALLNRQRRRKRGVGLTGAQGSQGAPQPGPTFMAKWRLESVEQRSGSRLRLRWPSAFQELLLIELSIFHNECTPQGPLPTLRMSLQIIHGWQTGGQVAVQSIQPGSVQCHAKETPVGAGQPACVCVSLCVWVFVWRWAGGAGNWINAD